MNLKDLEVYQLAMEVAEKIWSKVIIWEYFTKKTIGEQIAKSVDSIAANIAEGYGRYHYRENKQFCYYARGSLLETETWLVKAESRGLIVKEEYEYLKVLLEIIHKKLNSYINSIGKK